MEDSSVPSNAPASDVMNMDLSEPNTEDKVTEELNQETMTRIITLIRYYTDALAFCTLMKEASTPLLDILSSNVKAEVIEVMQFFVIAFSKSMEFAEVFLYECIKLSILGWCT